MEQVFYSKSGQALEELPREMVDTPSMETFKTRLDQALSNLIQLQVSLLTAGDLDQMTLKCPFQLKQFYDFMLPGDINMKSAMKKTKFFDRNAELCSELKVQKNCTRRRITALTVTQLKKSTNSHFAKKDHSKFLFFKMLFCLVKNIFCLMS